MVPPGTSANHRATLAMPHAGSTPAHATRRAPSLQSTEVSDAATPATVAIGTKGAASRLATTPTMLTDPWSSTTRGAVMAWAATGTASAGPMGASRVGSRAPMASPHGRVNSSNPRVATEDSANPNDLASHGSTTSTTMMAAPSTGSPAERRDRLSPMSPIAPIAAARTTLGSGLASTTKPARASSASSGLAHRGMPTRTHRPRTSPTTTATLLPLTAVRWVMPVARIASVRSGGVRLVSPMTSPGSRPRGSAGAPSTAPRSPARRCSAADATAPGGATTVNVPVTAMPATRSSPGSVGRSRPVSCTVDRHAGSVNAASPVSSTGAPVACCRPRASRCTTVASRSTRGVSPRDGKVSGSPVMTTSAVTTARWSMSS